MGNQISGEEEAEFADSNNGTKTPRDNKDKYKSFPGSAILEKTFCGSIDTTDPSEYEDINFANRLLKKADIMCISSPEEHKAYDIDPANLDRGSSSAMLARALVSEVTDNPKTMTQSEMAAREKQLLKAQQAAAAAASQRSSETTARPVGAPGGVGPPHLLSSLAFAVTGDETAGNVCVHPSGMTAKDSNHTSSMMSPGVLQENRAAQYNDDMEPMEPSSPHAVTIGICMSRRSNQGHPDTITRQTAYDFNELQDRQYKYVSSTDPTGWRAGGGESGGPSPTNMDGTQTPDKVAAPDIVHIPIIHINCATSEQADQVVQSLASGEVFIPHMAVLPEALSVNGISPPDLVVRFGCERNEDTPPDEWPNWCLEFMHNQLYEYFYSIGARWMKRPFSITLARKVKWKTVKHMNRYFAHAEQVVGRWRDRGPQLLNPQPEGGAWSEEITNPHGVYLLRGGVPTNYFSPNFDPPYTTKMTRALLENVLSKSWDKKRREWTSEPIPKLVTPNLLLAMACGCTDPTNEGFMAQEVTQASHLRRQYPAATSSPPVVHYDEQSSPRRWDENEENQSLDETDDASGERVSHFSGHEEADEGEHHQGSASMEEEEDEEEELEEEEEDEELEEEEEEEDEELEEELYRTESGGTDDTGPVAYEEKKMDDVAVSDKGKSRGSWRTNGVESSEVGQSQAGGSQANSGTTVVHANNSQRRDWASDSQRSDIRDMLDHEKKRQQELLSKIHSNDGANRRSSYTMTPVSPNKRGGGLGAEIEQSDSGASMEYSQDGSSAFMTEGGSTLMGQQFAGDSSVITTASKQTRSSTRSSWRDEDEDGTSALMSIQESSSSVLSAVPTDEELFAIGWAKALDTSSGNYYYYTLDRKKIVWENPLSANYSAESSRTDP